MDDVARNVTKALYGDNYNNSQYERVLTFLHDIEEWGKRFFGILTNLIESHQQE